MIDADALTDADAATDAKPAIVDKPMVKAHIIAGFACLLAMMLAGGLYALQFSRLYPFPGVELLSAGRVRMLHTNVATQGFLINLFIAGLYWVVPRLTGQPLLSKVLTRVLFWVWQAGVVATGACVLGGYAQAVEWGEAPIFVDHALVAMMALLVVNVGAPIVRMGWRNLYVTLWYVSAALVWTPLVYVMGNYLPQYVVGGAGGAVVSGLYVQDLLGLSLTALGLGLVFYFVPVIAKQPIWSRGLAFTGFWGLAFFSPQGGAQHFLWSPIPMYAQHYAVMATVAVAVVAFTVTVNLFMSLRGRGDLLRTSLPMRWFFTGVACYLIASLSCAFQSTLTLQKLIQFTDWAPGHAHLVMFGVFGFWVMGIVTDLWPKLVGHAWYSDKLNAWNYWLSTLGLAAMLIDLLAVGVMQGSLWQALAPWEKSITAAVPFWHVRTVAGGAMIVGQLLQAWNLWRTARLGKRAAPQEPQPAAEAA